MIAGDYADIEMVNGPGYKLLINKTQSHLYADIKYYIRLILIALDKLYWTSYDCYGWAF